MGFRIGRSSTAARLAGFYSLAFTLVTIALGVIIYWGMRAELRYELDQRILAERDTLLREGAGGRAALIRAIDTRTARDSEDMRYALIAPGGRLIAGNAPAGGIVPGWSEIEFHEKDGGTDGARSITTPLPDGGRLVVGADPESIERLDERLMPLFAGALGLMAVIGIGGGLMFRAALRHRIESINRTAEAIIGGDLARRVPISGASDEFDRLSATLNRMLDRISALMVNLRQVSGDVAHDLRTPLARLRQGLELARTGEPTPETFEAAVSGAIEQTDEMLALFAAILSISEIEAGGAAFRPRRIDLSDLTADLAESYLPAAEDGGRTLVRAIEPGIAIDGNRELIAQLLVNLLDNALRHTAPGCEITLRLTGEGDRAMLVVSDNGPGIPERDRARVFERFTRLEHSRSTPGHGLGLSLVAAIVRAHRATILLEDNRPGVKMIMRFERSRG